MGYLEHKQLAPKSVSCAVVIISGTRTEQSDESGKLIMQALKGSSHEVVSYSILKNDATSIRNRLSELLAEGKPQVIITSGGTGASRQDITIEMVALLLEKKLDGFGELFRFLSCKEIGTGAIMIRAVAGVARGKVVICLPGSVGAVKLAMEKIILPEIGHLLREATR